MIFKMHSSTSGLCSIGRIINFIFTILLFVEGLAIGSSLYIFYLERGLKAGGDNIIVGFILCIFILLLVLFIFLIVPSNICFDEMGKNKEKNNTNVCFHYINMINVVKIKPYDVKNLLRLFVFFVIPFLVGLITSNVVLNTYKEDDLRPSKIHIKVDNIEVPPDLK